MDYGRKAADLLPMVEHGELTFCYFSASYLAERVPEFALLDLPFAVRDRETGYAIFDGPLGAILTDRVASLTSWRLLAFWDNGFRHISNRVRPLRAPSDCAGLTIRTLMSDLHRQTFRRFGFSPIPLDVKELRDAVESGTIDAQDNSLTNIVNFRIHDHHRFVNLSGHFFGAAVVLCHGPTFEQWPEEVRAAVHSSVRQATLAQRKFAADEDEIALARLEEAGVEITHPADMDRAAFVRNVAPIVEAQKTRFGEKMFAYFV